MKYLLIDLYDGSNRLINEDEAAEWKTDTRRKKGAKIVWQGEEHLLIQL